MLTLRHSGGLHGTFSLRKPMRPNPVGAFSVRLPSREGITLVVRGLDCIDGTPLIDLKPDICPQVARAAGFGVNGPAHTETTP